MNYRDALRYFRDRSDYDRGFISNPFAGDAAAAAGLRRTRLLLDQLGRPDSAYPIIHVAGTKGKGSTCAFIQAIARASGLNTGMFVTPQLHSVRERTLLNGCAISEEHFSATIERVAAAVGTVEATHPELGSLTAFEISTAQSLLAFADESVELAIVEVGLGGRLDATNVITVDVSIITPISFDHEAILGDTLSAIAAEKAGIIKAGVAVVVGPQQPDALATIRTVADSLNSPLLQAGVDWSATWGAGASSFSGPWGEIRDIQLGLRGPHQADNAGTALMALWTLDRRLFDRIDNVRDGLAATTWPGRFEQINDNPIVIADGAHNVASMSVLVTALLREFGQARFLVILGSYRDKDLEGLLGTLEALSPRIIGTRSGSPRARDPEDIRQSATSAGYDAESAPTVAAALDEALRRGAADTIIVATGSLSIAAEAREYFGLAEVSLDEREILNG